MEKCTLCNHLTSNSDGNENIDDTFDPAHAVPPCVHNCATGARHFGDLNDPDSGASKALAAGEAAGKHIYWLDDNTDAKPATAYLLSPHIASWKGLI
jgi:Fe-S-cluster-containing dehydrogenase component